MTIEAIQNDYNYIKENIGNIPTERMIELYEKYLNGTDSYLCGVEYQGEIYGIFEKTLNTNLCACQTDHKKNIQYLRYRPHLKGSALVANDENAIHFGSTNEIYKLFLCKNKQGFNAGYCFEIAVYTHFGRREEWKQDNKPSCKGGDIRINEEEIQMKFVRKDSLATVTPQENLP